MASGSIALTSSNQYIVGSLNWSSTPNTAGNYSDVYVEMRMWRNNSGYTTYGTGSWNIYINGDTSYASPTISLTYDSNTYIMSYSVRVYHNADGTRSIGINCGGGISGTSYSATYCNGGSGATITLDTIPRASQPTLSAGTTPVGSSVTISTNRASTGFTHTISYAYGSIGKTTIATGVSDNTSWTLPTSLASQTPSATSGTGTIYCDTYNGGTLLGTKTVSFTASIPNTVTFQPSVGAVTTSETVSGVSALSLGKYVQGLSNVSFSITGIAGVFGSTVSTAKVTFNGTTYNASVSNGTATWTTGVLAVSGTLNYSVTVTDSRGYTDASPITGSITVLPYTAPLITSFSAKRCDSNGNLDEIGTYLFIDRDGTASSLKNGSAVEKNTLACTVAWSPKGQNSWTTMSEYTIAASSTLAISTTGIKSTKSDFTLTSAYDIKFTLTDKFNNTVSTQVVTVGTVMMSWGKTGVGIGKVWTQGALDVKGDIYENDVKLSDKYMPRSSGTVAINLLGASNNIEMRGTNSLNLYATQGTGGVSSTWVGFYDSAGTRQGWVGDGSTGNQNIGICAEYGNVSLVAGGKGFVFSGGDNSCTATLQADNSLKFTNSSGYIQILPQNTGWSHIYSDRTFVFNQGVWTMGNVVPYTTNYYYSGTWDNYWAGVESASYITRSDRNDKECISAIDNQRSYEDVKNLTPYVYRFTNNEDIKLTYGVMADQVPIEMVDHMSLSGVNLYSYTTMILSALKQTIEKVEVLEGEIVKLGGTV